MSDWEGESCHPDYSSLKRVSFFYFKRKYRKKTAQYSKRNERAGRQRWQGRHRQRMSRLHKKKAVLKVIKLNQGQLYDF